jgi:hypothetical protein
MSSFIDHFYHPKPSPRRDISNPRPFQTRHTHVTTVAGTDVWLVLSESGGGPCERVSGARWDISRHRASVMCPQSCPAKTSSVWSRSPDFWAQTPLLRVQRTKHRSKSPMTTNPVLALLWWRRSENSVQDSSSGWKVILLAAWKWTWRPISRERRRFTVNLFQPEINLSEGMDLRSICI